MARKVKQPHGGEVNTFEKGDPGGPGRPPKLLSAMLKELKAAGYEQVGPSTMLHTIEAMIGLPEWKLREMLEDPDIPIAQKIIAYHLQSKKDRVNLLTTLLDRAHGKAKQQIEQTGEMTINVNKRTDAGNAGS